MSDEHIASDDARTLLARYDALVAAAIRVVEDWEVDGCGKHAGKAVASLRKELSALRSGGAA